MYKKLRIQKQGNEFILTETELEEISEEYSKFCVQYEKDKFC